MKKNLLIINFILVAVVLTSCTVPSVVKIEESREKSTVIETSESTPLGTLIGEIKKPKQENPKIKEIKIKKEPSPSLIEVENNSTKEKPIEEVFKKEDTLTELNIEKKPTELDFQFGKAPNNYRIRIKSFLKKENIVSQDVLVKYIFSRPAKAIKKDKSWRGWFVDVDILKQANKRKIVKTKFYTILFQENKIVDVIEAGSKKGIIIKIK